MKNILIGIVCIGAGMLLYSVMTPEEIKSPIVKKDEFKEGFMEGCLEEGDYYDYCECTYNYLDLMLTDGELMKLAIDYSDSEDIDNLPEIVDDAIYFCLDEI